MNYSKEDIIRLVQEKNVRFIRLQFTDIFGTLKNVSITTKQLEKALNNECMFDGSSIEGFVRIEESDMYLRPDPDSFVIFPWNEHDGREARLICDIYNCDGTPFEGDPRYVLKRVLKEAEDLGYTLNVGPELEFFLFKTDENGNPTTHTNDEASYFDLGPVDMGEGARRDICLALEEMGFEIEASHHEVAQGQHEIDFKYGEALRTADNMMTFKLVVKTLAQRHGLHATFMPKPIFGIAGNGMHLNQSLCKDGVNAFYNQDNQIGLSNIAYNYIAGLLDHAKAMAAITNPLVNSYKRLVPGYEAPVYIAWSARNRSPLVRIPASRGAGTRLELRHPDPSCNPYLALAVALAAGLDGIKNNLQPPKPADMNIFEMCSEELKERHIDILPEDLNEAIGYMENSEFMRKALGDHIYYRYIEAKKIEWDLYKTQVHQWEISRYLKTY